MDFAGVENGKLLFDELEACTGGSIGEEVAEGKEDRMRNVAVTKERSDIFEWWWSILGVLDEGKTTRAESEWKRIRATDYKMD